jgi:nucleoredoxin
MAHLLLEITGVRRALPLLCLFVFCGLARGGQLPMNSKEIGLMLRSGYSSPTVLRELSKRHFADTLDAEKESLLLKAGATDELVAALKNGTYTLSPKEAAELAKSAARPTGPAAAQGVHASGLVSPPPSLTAGRTGTQPGAGVNALYSALKGDLVKFYGSVIHADDEAVAGKKLIALYFSAHWCPPCRKFTPQLVDFYNRMAPQHPEFEIVFVSYDRTAADMEMYMRETGMPWPAVAFDKIPGKEAIKKYAGSGIPCLVLIDSAGKVLSDSFAGTQYVGPQKVLADTTAILSGGADAHLAQSR